MLLVVYLHGDDVVFLQEWSRMFGAGVKIKFFATGRFWVIKSNKCLL